MVFFRLLKSGIPSALALNNFALKRMKTKDISDNYNKVFLKYLNLVR